MGLGPAAQQSLVDHPFRRAFLPSSGVEERHLDGHATWWRVDDQVTKTCTSKGNVVRRNLG